MRKTCCSSKTDSTSRLSSLGLLERRPERLLDDHPHLGALEPVQALLAELADDHREERRRRREVEAAVQPLVGLLVEGLHRLLEAAVEVAPGRTCPRRSARSRTAASRTASSGARREYLRTASVAISRNSLVGHLAARDPDEVEALGQRAVVGEVVERGQQLAVGEVARRAEDREVRRVDGQPLEALGERVVVDDLRRAWTGRSCSQQPPDPLGERADAGGRVVAGERHPLRRAGRARAASRGRRSPARA